MKSSRVSPFAASILGKNNQHLAIARFALLAGICLIVGPINPASAATEYTSQNSATTYYHSAICTTSGDMWDTQFAGYFNAGIGGSANATGTTYNEAAFDFNECFGGGMIDELTALNLAPAAFTSAARSEQLSWGFDKPSNTWEAAYNIPFMTSIKGGNQFSKAASTAHDTDIFGPVAGPYKDAASGTVYGPENCQYTSSGSIGDGIVLGGQNAYGNSVANNNYIAILFAGNDIAPADTDAATTSVIDYNSLMRTYNTLIGAGYKPANIYIMYPSTGGQELSPSGTKLNTVFAGATVVDAKASNLKTSLTTWLGGQTTSKSQIFYWNGQQHGTAGFDVYSYLKNNVTNATKYTFNLTQQFIQTLQNSVKTLQSMGDTNTDDYPTFAVDTTSPLTTPLSIYLDGDSSPLTLTDNHDVYGDGSLYEYDFELSSADDANLLTTGDSVTLDWSGSTPSFSDIELDQGNGVGDASDTVPEPASTALIGLPIASVLLRRRAKNLAR